MLPRYNIDIMSSDISGGDIKVDELVYRASLRKNFWPDIKSIRKKYNIPINGYLTEMETTGWYVNRGAKLVEYILEHNLEALKEVVFFDDDLITLLKKYSLPIIASDLIVN